MVVPPLEVELFGMGHRKRIPPVTLRNFVTNTATIKPLQCYDSPTSVYPIDEFVDCARFSVSHQAFLAAITKAYEPHMFNQAVVDKIWRDAMGNEIRAMEETNTWTIETLPKGKKVIGSKWVYTVKYKSDGTIERYKARLVAMGNRQIEGVDYSDTFAPVV